MRTAFIDELIIQARNNNNIFLLVGDLGFSVVEPFAQEFPDRFINVGIAEQNLAGIASGLAMEGFCVFIYSIGNFPTLRCIEQIRNDICYYNISVKIVSVGAGFSYASLGPSHHGTEDIAILRALPNITLCSPGDPFEAREIVKLAVKNKTPFYIRLGKAGEPNVHSKSINKPDISQIGSILQVVNKGEDIRYAIFATGSVMSYCYDYIIGNKIPADLYSFPFIKPIDDGQLLSIFKKGYQKVITIEEHQKNGGFGSCILEKLNLFLLNGHIEKSSAPFIEVVGIEDQFISVAGTQSYLREIANISLTSKQFTV